MSGLGVEFSVVQTFTAELHDDLQRRLLRLGVKFSVVQTFTVEVGARHPWRKRLGVEFFVV